MENNDRTRALDMAKLMVANARRECNNRSVSREIAFACIFIHRAHVSLSDACNYYKESDALQKRGLARELGIEVEDLFLEGYSTKRLTLFGEVAKLNARLDKDLAVRDPFRVIEEVTRIDEIVRYLGFTFNMLKTNGATLDALFMEAYGALDTLSLDRIMEQYRK